MFLVEQYARIRQMDNRMCKSNVGKMGTKYIGAKYGKGNRNTELSWKTRYNKMMKSKAFSSPNLPSTSSPLSYPFYSILQFRIFLQFRVSTYTYV